MTSRFKDQKLISCLFFFATEDKKFLCMRVSYSVKQCVDMPRVRLDIVLFGGLLGIRVLSHLFMGCFLSLEVVWGMI